MEDDRRAPWRRFAIAGPVVVLLVTLTIDAVAFSTGGDASTETPTAAKLRTFRLPSRFVDPSTPGGTLPDDQTVPKVHVLLPGLPVGTLPDALVHPMSTVQPIWIVNEPHGLGRRVVVALHGQHNSFHAGIAGLSKEGWTNTERAAGRAEHRSALQRNGMATLPQPGRPGAVLRRQRHEIPHRSDGPVRVHRHSGPTCALQPKKEPVLALASARVMPIRRRRIGSSGCPATRLPSGRDHPASS